MRCGVSSLRPIITSYLKAGLNNLAALQAEGPPGDMADQKNKRAAWVHLRNYLLDQQEAEQAGGR